MDIKKLQDEVNHRWELQIDNPCHHSADANHALVHVMKAAGKLASALNDAEHEQRLLSAIEVEKYLADLVICAARLAHGVVDLEAACVSRLAEKFPAVAGDAPGEGVQPTKECPCVDYFGVAKGVCPDCRGSGVVRQAAPPTAKAPR